MLGEWVHFITFLYIELIAMTLNFDALALLRCPEARQSPLPLAGEVDAKRRVRVFRTSNDLISTLHPIIHQIGNIPFSSSRKVSISTPVLVTRRVCSHCADSFLSLVTAIFHPSFSRCFTSAVP